MLLVHVTHFNALMWNNGRTPVRVVEHGVKVPADVQYDGSLERGLTVVNNIARRGRRLGGDILSRAQREVPIDLVGMGAEEAGGLGEVLHGELSAFSARYRFLFNPIRYTSLGLAVIEAMMIGMPVVALATTEMATVIENGKSGYAGTDVDALIAHMRALLREPALARRMGQHARAAARQRFGIERFVSDWKRVFAEVTATAPV
jgi:glycosyltransferase involved in cell wall biosynthesis